MTLALFISEAAQHDIIEIARYLSQESADAASRFVDSVWETGSWLTRAPEAGRRVHTRLERLAGLRKLQVRGFPNYLVVYRSTSTSLTIERVFHGATDWRARLRRG